MKRMFRLLVPVAAAAAGMLMLAGPASASPSPSPSASASPSPSAPAGTSQPLVAQNGPETLNNVCVALLEAWDACMWVTPGSYPDNIVKTQCSAQVDGTGRTCVAELNGQEYQTTAFQWLWITGNWYALVEVANSSVALAYDASIDAFVIYPLEPVSWEEFYWGACDTGIQLRYNLKWLHYYGAGDAVGDLADGAENYGLGALTPWYWTSGYAGCGTEE